MKKKWWGEGNVDKKQKGVGGKEGPISQQLSGNCRVEVCVKKQTFGA